MSTDYDTSDRLYFEPLTAEDVLEIARVEASAGELCGVIVQLGGQTPLKLAQPLEAAGIPILGTSPDAIDLAEDRERFQKLLNRLGLRQPSNAICIDPSEAQAKAERIGFPVVIRPSYVLGGRAMRIVHEPGELAHFMVEAARLSDLGPILIDRYLAGRDRGRRRSSWPTARSVRRRRSWSTSRRPASIPATAPARCRRTRSARRCWPRSAARPTPWRGRSRSAA